MTGKTDPEHLRFASEQAAVLVTLDQPFAGLTSGQVSHAGLVCWTGKDSDIGGMVSKLTDFAEQHTSETTHGRVFWVK
jgi:hypothetical protein